MVPGRLILALASLFLHAAAADGCSGEEACPSRPAGAALLQRALKPSSLAAAGGDREAGRNKAVDARFLMQATFGPTAAALEELSKMSYAAWIKEQMAVPPGLHREFYRARVNPAFQKGYGDKQIYRAEPCDKGRFLRFALTMRDEKARAAIAVSGRDVAVSGAWRTLRGEGDWPSLGKSFTGFVCRVIEEVEGDAYVSRSRHCARHTWKLLKNLALRAKDAVKLQASFQQVAGRPGIAILQSTAGRCELQRPAKGELFIEVAGEHYRYDDRFRLVENTPEKPSFDYASCVRIDGLNGGRCKLAPLHRRPQREGLIVEVHDASHGPCRFLEELPSPRPLATIHDANVDHFMRRASRNYWPEHPELQHRLAYQWRGELLVRKAGSYTFFLGSDDGARLHVAGKLLLEHRGCNTGFLEKKGALELEAGRHRLLLDHYQLINWQGIVLSWQGPDSGGEREVVPEGALLTPASMLEPESCSVSCGSPGEAASRPELGHQLQMRLSHNLRDRWYDNRYRFRIQEAMTNSITWTNRVLYAEDQLRQRMAWALSQVLVVSTVGTGKDSWPELWTKYYDIFVRHAFGSFFDVLKEVTYSPIMGLYLTHSDSSSYDYNGAFANENYAREVMQLFSIGLDMLNPDGSTQHDEEGKVLPTYTNDQILSLARVFSGFSRSRHLRKNIEANWFDNFQDTMQLRAEMHDVQPKPDLLGGYIGDGFPLCEDPLPPGSFLAKGARYEFLGFDSADADVLELEEGSKLGAAICPGGKCELYAVVLAEGVACSGAECGANDVAVVKVGEMLFRYVPPACVHLQFSEQTAADPPPEPQGAPGSCFLASGKPTSGSVKLDGLKAAGAARESECLAKCRAFGATGCRLSWHSHDHGCVAETSLEAFRGGGDYGKWVKCWHFGDTGRHGHNYVLLTEKVAACPEGTRVGSLAECQAAAESIGLELLAQPWVKTRAHYKVPGGCSYQRRKKKVLWNGLDAMFPGLPDHLSICRAHFKVAEDGAVLQPDGATGFAVAWRAAPAEPGLHLAGVRSRAVFEGLPSREEALRSLRVGAHPPAGRCSVCQGDVKVYGGSAIDASTVFEVEGRFLRNVESVVTLRGGREAFRNPPQFLRYTEERRAHAKIEAEVDAALAHLVRHPNCPVFLAKRLIARFTSSNPSGGYVEAVQAAFRSGAYGGVTYSGNYGDLGATLAAILLHPEARDEEKGVSTTLNGALREPMLKVLHLMRSMEYKDVDDELIVLRHLEDVMGEFPYKAPTVFNHFNAAYELPRIGLAAQAGKGRSEPVLAPEFQIFTPPYVVGYLNGMHSLVDMGVTGRCHWKGLMGIGAWAFKNGGEREVCPQGRLEYKGREGREATLEELDVLLTGGRLSPKAREVVGSAYDGATEGRSLKEAQKALVMTAEFNTMGASLPLPGEREEYQAPEGGSAQPYKAVVLLYLGGGADTWNLVVPQACEQYEDYRAMRTDLSLEPSELQEISTNGQRCGKFGLHGGMPFLKELYEGGEAAFLTNIGNLVEPTSLADFRSNKAERCFNLFSHFDQANGAMTLKCQQAGTSPNGAGGRMGDALAKGKSQYKTASYATSSVVWSMGAETQRRIVSGSGPVSFRGFEEWHGALQNITGQHHGNAYAEVYAESLRTAVAQSKDIAELLGRTKLSSSHDFRGSSLESQLMQVAKLIAARGGRRAERDFFFVAQGPYDTHQRMKESLLWLFPQLDRAIRVFVEEMKAQGVWESVVLTTASEFGRTLSSNGGGSDHGWAGQHVVAGGAVRGGRIFNRYPASLTASPFDVGRGRLIPEFPWESFQLPLAEWLGVEREQYGEVFPNLGNFNASHFIPRAALFKS